MLDRRLNKFIGKAERYVWLSVLLNCFRLGCSVVFAYAFGTLVIRLITVRDVPNQIPERFALALIVAAIVLRDVLVRLIAKANLRIVAEVKANLRETILERTFLFGRAVTEQLSGSASVQLTGEGVEQLENYFGSYLTHFYYCLASAVILFLCVWPLNRIAATIVLIGALSIPLTLLMILKKVKKIQRKYWASYMNVGQLFLDSLEGLTTLKIFGADDRRAEEIEAQSEKFRVDTMALLSNQLNSILGIDLIAYGGAVACILVSAWQVYSGNGSLYQLIVIVLLSADFFLPMRELTSRFHVAMTGVAAGEKILAFLDAAVPERDGDKPFPIGTDVLVRSLTYSYSDGTIALRDVSLEIPRCGMTALVGKSGSGKTTLAALLSGQILPPKNTIFFTDGSRETEFYEVNRDVLDQSITRVAHNGHIFAGSVADNLRLGLSGALVANDKTVIETAMWRALDIVSLGDFFRSADGLDTALSAGGTNLSGGQAQRLSLARALLHDSPVYIFDEANSNIDRDSEEIILEVIRAIAMEKPVLYISHRMATVRDAQRIVVLEDGCVRESGTHEALMQAGDLYAALVNEQADLERFAETLQEKAGAV